MRIASPKVRIRTATLIGALTLSILAAAAPQALSRTGSRPTLTASSTFVVFNQHVRLSGSASTPRVTLLARRFGDSHYRSIATARVRGGRFTFSTSPGLATSYEVSAGTRRPAISRPVQVYVHLDVKHFTCTLCGPPQTTAQTQLKYSLVIGVPSSDETFVLSEPVYLYVGVGPGRVAVEKRVGSVKPRRSAHGTVTVSGSLPVSVAAGAKLRFTACDRSAERRTGVGLPSVHDCGAPELNHRQFMHYVG